jgi:hypothetical protein
MASTASTATRTRKKLTLRMTYEDERRLEERLERRRVRLAQADGLGTPERLSRTALALHYMRRGMTEAENAEVATSDRTPTPNDDKR